MLINKGVAMRKLKIFIFIVLSFLLLAVVEAGAATRTALVIGNGAYKSSSLKNPVNDATDMANALRQSGFNVTLKLNIDHRSMERSIRDFGKKLRDGGIGLFYYAGHGVQVKGRNYLIPITSEIESEADVKFEAVDAGLVLGKMEDAQNDLNIIILDACRNNPFARSFRSSRKGLARMDAPTGSLIAYATAPGSIAADGKGKNGVYTKHLLTNIRKPGLTIERILKNVRVAVLSETSNKQVPWESSSLAGDFYFHQPEKRKVSVQQKKDKNESSINSYELLFWESIKDSKDAESFKAYLKQFPGGTFSELAALKIKRFSVQPETDTAEKGNLFVSTVPANARIRILNIKPKFRQGIELDPGKYLIEVSQTGYQAVKRWETLDTKEKKTLEIRLEKQKLLQNNPVKLASISPADKESGIIARDGQYNKYKNGIVYDKHTRLEWVVGPEKYMGSDVAKKWVNNLNLDGGGWRMPSTRELEGIYKLGAGTRNMTSLLKTSGWFVWSSAAGGFSFSSGNFGNYGTSNVCRAFAVRHRLAKLRIKQDSKKSKINQTTSSLKETSKIKSEPKPEKEGIKIASVSPDDKGPKRIARDGQYIKYKNGIVYDKSTGLEWYAGPDEYMGGYAARSWVENCKTDGGDWRMPSTRELEGIYKLGAGTRNMTSLLKTSGWFVWSSAAGGFSFSSGNFGNYGTSNVCRAFAVRGEGVGYLSKKPDKTEPIHNDRGMKSELDQQKENSNIKQDLKKAGETLLDIGEIVLPLLQWFW
jgi:hypothetical protein